MKTSLINHRAVEYAFILLMFIHPLFLYSGIVNTSIDDGTTPGSLRFEVANATSGDIIDIQAGIGTIILSQGEIVINKNLIIKGQGPHSSNAIIDGNNASRIFNVQSSYTLQLEYLWLQNGNAGGGSNGSDGGTGANGAGGSIGVSAIDWIDCPPPPGKGDGGSGGNGQDGTSGSVGTNGSSGDNGGAIYSDGYVICYYCTFYNNFAGSGGNGGNGGAGGDGGSGGPGGNGAICECSENPPNGGNGGNGANGGCGGNGGNGGSGGNGGAVYSAYRLECYNCTFYDNFAGVGGSSGIGGGGGFAGIGGMGGGPGSCVGGGPVILGQPGNNGGNGSAGSPGSSGSGGLAGNGGAIYNYGNESFENACYLENCTFSTNKAGESSGNGGAFFNHTKASILNCTFDGNSCTSTGDGCGIYNIGVLHTRNTLYSNNDNLSGKYDVYNAATLNSLGQNICEVPYPGGVFSGSNDLSGTTYDPLLSGLLDNGGPTYTKAIGNASSPAVDPPSNNSAPDQDQRDYYRKNNADRGAFEYNGVYCPSVLIVTDADISGTETYHAQSDIYLGNGSSFLVRNTGTLHCVASNKIHISPPFRAYNGSSLWIFIDSDPCHWTYSPSPRVGLDFEEKTEELASNIVSIENVKVYPNPCDGIFTIFLEGNINETYSVDIYNSIGLEVFSRHNIKQNLLQIDISQVSAGVYLINIIKDYRIIMKRIIIR